MCAPGLAGQWLDRRWETGFLAILGFAVGLVGSMAYLIAATKSLSAKRDRRREGARPFVDEDANREP